MPMLYHGSSQQITGAFTPALLHKGEDYTHTKPSVFATERKDVAALFMFPEDVLASIGFENDVAYICIWGTREDFAGKDKPGYLYEFSSDTFERVGKDYEWQCFTPVSPTNVIAFPSSLDGLIASGALVYFIDDENIFDQIVANKNTRLKILKDYVSENVRRG